MHKPVPVPVPVASGTVASFAPLQPVSAAASLAVMALARCHSGGRARWSPGTPRPGEPVNPRRRRWLVPRRRYRGTT
ncbi:MAG: hypothetical protein ACYC90_14350, partial [Candidatus Nanopelagicales bacterium]